jgi:hypothetical protein
MDAGGSVKWPSATYRAFRRSDPILISKSNRLNYSVYHDNGIFQRLGDPKLDQDHSAVKTSHGIKVIDAATPVYEAYEGDEECRKRMPEVDDFDPETYEEYILAQVHLPRVDEHRLGTAIRRAKDGNDRPIGKYYQNPPLDTRIFEVEFSDGQVLEYAANVIAENLYSQVDEEGPHQVMLDEIVNHKSDKSAVLPEDGYITLKGRRHRHVTTKGWKLCIQWKEGSTSWQPLSDMKEAYPVRTAEDPVANKLEYQPAFAWWVTSTLWRRDRIGIELPKTVREAVEIDRRTGTNYWREALDLEMKNVRVAFDVLEGKDEIPQGYQQIRGHLILKSRWVHFVGRPDMLLMDI